MHEFKCGDRVIIVNQDRYFKYSLVNRSGTVITRYANNIGVQMDDLFNSSSGKGLFYFEPKQLIHGFKKEENNMATNISNITNYHNAVRVKFIGDSVTSRYVFANFNTDVEVGDLVVVKPAHHDIALARVDEILEGKDYETTREVINKVYTEAYNARVKVREQVAKVKAQMEERARKLQDIALYQMLAKDDSEMAELLKEYQNLAKV